jgi:hypothetical protein
MPTPHPRGSKESCMDKWDHAIWFGLAFLFAYSMNKSLNLILEKLTQIHEVLTVLREQGRR